MIILLYILEITSTFHMLEKEDIKESYPFYTVTRINKDLNLNPNLVKAYGEIDFQFINNKEILALCDWFLEDILNLEEFLEIIGNTLLAKPDINREDHIKTFRICVLSFIYNKPIPMEKVNLRYLDFLKHLARQLYYPILRLSYYGIATIESLNQREKDVIFELFFDKSFVFDKNKKINGLPAVIVKRDNMLKFIRVVFDNFDRNKVNIWLKEYKVKYEYQKETKDKSLFRNITDFILEKTKTDFI